MKKLFLSLIILSSGTILFGAALRPEFEEVEDDDKLVEKKFVALKNLAPHIDYGTIDEHAAIDAVRQIVNASDVKPLKEIRREFRPGGKYAEGGEFYRVAYLKAPAKPESEEPAETLTQKKFYTLRALAYPVDYRNIEERAALNVARQIVTASDIETLEKIEREFRPGGKYAQGGEFYRD